MTPDDPRHGTIAGHSTGCRCRRCMDAKNLYERRRRKLRRLYGVRYAIDAAGTRRRIEAMSWMGWPMILIAQECGWTTGEAVGAIRQRRWVERSTVEAVQRAYNRLSMTPGPSKSAHLRAVAKGWRSPLVWDDETIDDPGAVPEDSPAGTFTVDEQAVYRRMRGDRTVALTPAEKAEVIRRMTLAGRSYTHITAVTGITKPDRYLTLQSCEEVA